MRTGQLLEVSKAGAAEGPKKGRVFRIHGPDVFIDPAGYQAHLDLQEKNFKAKLDEQQKAASK